MKESGIGRENGLEAFESCECAENYSEVHRWLIDMQTRKANLLANFVMLSSDSNKKISNRAPSDYLKDVETSLGEKLLSALEANLISPAAYAAAKSNDYDSFIVERARTIYERSKELTGW